VIFRNAPAFSGGLLIALVIFAGCLVPVPLQVPVQVQPQVVPTPDTGMLAFEPSFTEPATTTTPPAVPEESPPIIAGEQTVPATEEPTLSQVFSHALPAKTVYSYADNVDFHSLSVSVGNTQMRTGFYYNPGSAGSQSAHWEAAPGNKFLMVGVKFYMTGIRKEGKSSLFMTPLACSFELVKGGSSYGVLNASDIPDMDNFYIHDVGTMYRDRFIDKDNDGSGVLMFEVPQSFDITGAYVTFCPRNLASWTGYYRSPDDWDCTGNPVVWRLG
jgi:hypothetical protein